VTVYKLVVKDTVEQRILKLQAKKAALAEGALSMSKQKLSEMRLEDLKMLFSSY
jgi:SNF2 family DNA or RNA helicase